MKREYAILLGSFLAALSISSAAGQTALTGSADSGNAAAMNATPSAYILGPNDKISIRTNDVEEVKYDVRIGQDGRVTLPQIGQLTAVGLTTEQLQKEIATRLEKYVRRPDVTVEIFEFHSQPISVIGAVKAPGVYQVEGRKTLAEVLAMAGGTNESASYQVKITRRPEWGMLPLSGATLDATSRCSVAEVDLKVLTEALDPRQNIEVRPNDVISVPRAAMIYVAGEVKHAGPVVLTERRNISVLQALSDAEGLATDAAPQKTRILRLVPQSERRAEILVDVRKIYEGKANDVPLQPEDILFIPTNQSKKALVRTLEALITTGSGVAVYRSATLF
jgi:polysaccharide export outer membrane protein